MSMAEKCFSVIQLLLITFFCVFGLVHDVGADTLYFATGESFILNPRITGIPTDILWRHEGNKAVEWDPTSNLVYREYREFKDKTTLNITTGELTVRGLTKSFSGSYRAECTIQGEEVLFTQRIEVLDPVSQPVVSCVQTNETTTLRCFAQGDLLQYRWSGPGLEGATWREEETGGDWRRLNTTSEPGNYTCMVKNPVSEERKDFNTRDCGSADTTNTTQGIVAGIVAGLLFICLVIGLFCYLKKQANGKHSGDSEHGDHQTPTNTVSEFGTDGLRSSPDIPASTVYTSERETAGERTDEGAEEGREMRMREEGKEKQDDRGNEREEEEIKTPAQDPPAPGDMKTLPPRSSKGKHSGDSEHGDHPTPTTTVSVFGTDGLRSSPDTPASTVNTSERETAGQEADVSLLSVGERKEKIQANIQEGSEQDESQPLLQEPNRANDEEVDEDSVNISVCEKARMFEKLVSLTKDESGQLTGEREKILPKRNEGETKGEKLTQDPPAPGDMKTLQADVQERSEQDESQPLLQELEPNRANNEEVDPGPFNRSSVHGRARMFEKWMKDESGQLTDEREKTLPKTCEGGTKRDMPVQDLPAPRDTKTLPEEPPVSSGAVGQNPPMSLEGHRRSTDHNAVQEATIEEVRENIDEGKGKGEKQGEEKTDEREEE